MGILSSELILSMGIIQDLSKRAILQHLQKARTFEFKELDILNLEKLDI